MKTTTLQLLPTTSFGTPSGNYDGSSVDWEGDRAKAAAYYVRGGGLQTVAYFLTGFVGTINCQGSVATNPTTDADWFIVDTYTASSTTTSNFSKNINGNLSWLRAEVKDFSAGSIQKLMVSY